MTMTTRSMTEAAFNKNTFDTEETRSITRSMSKKTFDKRKIGKRTTFKSNNMMDDILPDKRRNIKNSTVMDFVDSSTTCNELDESVLTVPGVGVVNMGILEGEGIMTVSDLVDVFFELEKGVDGAYYEFHMWLKDIGINSHRDTITMCVSAKWYLLMKVKGSPSKVFTGERGVFSHMASVTIFAAGVGAYVYYFM